MTFPLRPIDGVFLLDKPIGITSNAALQQVKKLFSAKKAGHTGSLDPLASGMLPICFGRATKLCQYFLEHDKTYQVTAELGKTTTTGDAEGEVIATQPIPSVSQDEMEQHLAFFRGQIQQIPSMYSALKYQGKPLYEYARKGITVPRAARTITIFQLTLDKLQPDTMELTVHCSKGTYIRTLITDIGERLGCGAYVTQLRRVQVGDFHEADMMSLAALKDAMASDPAAGDKKILSISEAIKMWPAHSVVSGDEKRLRDGHVVGIPAGTPGSLIRILSADQALIGIGKILTDNTVKMQTLLR